MREPDTEVVCSDVLADLVRGFLKRWGENHPRLSTGGGEGGGTRDVDVIPLRGTDWLAASAARLDLSVSAEELLFHLNLIVPGFYANTDSVAEHLRGTAKPPRRPTTDFWVADALLTEIGMQYVFYADERGGAPAELPVYQRGQSCCGGVAAARVAA